jgi:hypothetical protein
MYTGVLINLNLVNISTVTLLLQFGFFRFVSSPQTRAAVWIWRPNHVTVAAREIWIPVAAQTSICLVCWQSEKLKCLHFSGRRLRKQTATIKFLIFRLFSERARKKAGKTNGSDSYILCALKTTLPFYVRLILGFMSRLKVNAIYSEWRFKSTSQSLQFPSFKTRLGIIFPDLLPGSSEKNN